LRPCGAWWAGWPFWAGRAILDRHQSLLERDDLLLEVRDPAR
jgi:hypothetical protein